MGFLGKIFGHGGDSIEGLRKAIEQKRFVDAKLLVEKLTDQSLSETEMDEVEQLRIVAGDGLAGLNLEEALGLQRCGHFDRAAEHLHLAQEQVCSAGLAEKIEEAIAAEPLVPEIDASVVNPSASSPLAACSACVSQSTTLLNDEDAIFGDDDSQLELILTSYPADLAERYTSKSATFKAAFLLSHAGQDGQALPLWREVEVVEQDDLYWFELGSLLGRTGQLEDACPALEIALEKNSELLLAIEALVPILIGLGDYPLAEERLLQFLDQGVSPEFCYAQLTSLYVQQQKYSDAAEYARQAIAAENLDPRFLLLAASVLEHVGALAETENVLKMIPASGHGGGTSLPLAEFWLRQKRELGTILDTFNTACREEPEEPRWQLRVAQTYLAKNWIKDGLKILRLVVNDPRLDPELAQEAAQLLAEQQG
ncbi:MAG: tetratricopeptide repeat protein [Thermodesulfobacteriota bacterium]|nr:tetratricopeptide repeat protein [Thermodesulfobacteriota bacterium]